MMVHEDKGGKNKINFKGGCLAVVCVIPREGGRLKWGDWVGSLWSTRLSTAFPSARTCLRHP